MAVLLGQGGTSVFLGQPFGGDGRRPTQILTTAQAMDGAATVSVLNTAAITTSGAGGAAVHDGVTGHFVQHTTGATSGNTGGWLTGSNDEFRLQNTGDCTFVMRTGGDISSTRLWVGVFSGGPSGSDDPAATHLLGFRYSTGVPETTWKACSKDGTTLNPSDTLVTVAIDTTYYFRIKATSTTSVDFYLGTSSTNLALVATKTTNLPTTTTALGFAMQITTLTNAARAIRCQKMEVRRPI